MKSAEEMAAISLKAEPHYATRQLEALQRVFDKAAEMGENAVHWGEELYPFTLSELKRLGYQVTDNGNHGDPEVVITW